MEVRFVPDEGGLAPGEGFFEAYNKRLVRVPGATVQIAVESPEIRKVISYEAIKDARRTDTSPSFPGQQHSGDLKKSFCTEISGKGVISGQGARRRTTLSILGSEVDFTALEVQLQSARLEDGEEITGFSVDWLCQDYIPPSGGFILDGRLANADMQLLYDELQSTDRALLIELGIGLFPGFFGEWSFDGWDGGRIIFADRNICSHVVVNHKEIPSDFFDPEQPYKTHLYTAGPHKLIKLLTVAHNVQRH